MSTTFQESSRSREHSPPSSEVSDTEKPTKRSRKDKGKAQVNSRRKTLTFQEKLDICIDKKRNKLKNTDIVRKYNLSPSTVSDIIRGEEKWRKLVFSDGLEEAKRGPKSYFPEIEEGVSMWCEQAILDGVTFNGTILQNKAKKIADLLEIDESKFSATSDGWLRRFKERNNLHVYKRKADLDSIDYAQIPVHREELQKLLQEYDSNNIFNCDETALYWKLEPSHTLAHNPILGKKKPKGRITLMLTCNVTGTEKLPLLFIHKSENPRPLKGIEKSSLPVWYYWNAKAWMMQSVFGHYLRRLDNMMRKANRKIILLADNATSHKTEAIIKKLTNVKVHFLPPNTTSVLQPLDQGIIYNLKAHYRSILCENRIEEYDALRSRLSQQQYLKPTPMDSLPALTILDAINFSSKAWNRVTQTTIQSSWMKAKILPATINLEMATINEENTEFEITTLINKLPIEDENISVHDFIDFESVTMSNNNDIEDEEFSLKEIVSAIRGEDINEEEEERVISEKKVTSSRTILGLDDFVLFCHQEDLGVDAQFYDQLKWLRNRIVEKRQIATGSTMIGYYAPKNTEDVSDWITLLPGYSIYTAAARND
ncbi:3557_t:CDS:2 [Ambispora gerdemannii]|uniref:3557_t:CDS:1 n=1 Tax=Ambispora gerdemannii TaxID=144530 RepID=A0A9N9DJ97_9GLOM|nr:3557_t:CDS:2 [Ambispora gerdemannii]